MRGELNVIKAVTQLSFKNFISMDLSPKPYKNTEQRTQELSLGLPKTDEVKADIPYRGADEPTVETQEALATPPKHESLQAIEELEASRTKVQQVNQAKQEVAQESAMLQARFKQLTTFLDKHPVMLMASFDKETGHIETRPMRVAHRVNNIDLFFFTNKNASKIDRLDKHPQVCLSIYDPTTCEWICINGTPTLTSDRALIATHYNDSIKGWLTDLKDSVHDGGPQDPRLALLGVKTTSVKFAPRAKQTLANRAKEVFFHSDDTFVHEIDFDAEELDRMRLIAL
jgi:general stress protein 26